MRSIFGLASWPCLALFVLLSVAARPMPAHSASGDDRAVCDQAARIASQESGVPVKVLKAIGRTESGRTVQGAFVPWPWTINVEGRGMHLDSPSEALAIFEQNFARGARNIDVGCFQINHRWHGDAFESVRSMMDPITNARYAARFLGELYLEFGDWTRAAGAFHSRNAEFSSKYLARYEPILRALDGDRGPLVRTAETPKVNDFPLLTGSSGGGVMGSLFPTAAASRGSLFARDERG
jgi:hypothetical protein